VSDASFLRVVLVKPSKYATDGAVERFRRGFMPNSTLPYLASLTPGRLTDVACEVHAIDEYVKTDLAYLDLFEPPRDGRTLVALVGVQSHQFHRALDLAALARSRGACAVIGGPHPMTCDTAPLEGRGVSFAFSEAEMIWPEILADAARGELALSYGGERRWTVRLDPPVLKPPSRRDLGRYVVPMLGVYPARGCPYSCNFCSVIKIAGHRVRSQPVEKTLATLRAARRAGVKLIFFTSDNFNKIPQAVELLDAIAAERIEIPFFVQCDAQIYRQPDLVEQLARAGCFQMFVGAESFHAATLAAAHKFHNTPERYGEIVRLCRANGITSHFSNILGFPQDTEKGIREHLETLRALDPDVASFYILTPVPGTEQYAEFREKGLLVEENLDRFDGTETTWRHPNLPGADLKRLLFFCYRRFYRARDVARRLARVARFPRDFRRMAALTAVIGYPAQSRAAVWRGRHPMAGGFFRVWRDRAEDYRELRRSTYGLAFAPLPDSRELSAADQETNRGAKLG
jgi:radical SAM superfamily enzyme YgiQ (UPF0313 family)